MTTPEPDVTDDDHYPGKMQLPKYASVLEKVVVVVLMLSCGFQFSWCNLPADCTVRTRAQICVTLPLRVVEK